MLDRIQPWHRPLGLLALVSGFILSASSALAQFPTSIQDLGPPKIDEIGTEAKRRMQHADEYLKAGKWSDAIDTLQQVMDEYQGFVPLDEPGGSSKRRYLQHVTPQLYCAARLSRLPPEALKLYRDRVDPQARQWYQAGIADRDAAQLEKVATRAFASSVGDDALFALGETALSQGDFGRARSCWQQILPDAPVPGRLVYPDTDLDPAVIRSRLILVSILEGALDRAAAELDKFAEQYPAAQGRMSGRQGPLAPALRDLLTQAATWPRDEPSANWPTFAGNLQRNKRLPRAIDVAGRKWSIPLERVRGNERDTGTRRPAENRLSLLSYHPLLVGNLVLYNTEDKIYAFDVTTGQPAWPTPDGDGAIYRLEDPLGAAFQRSRPQSDGVPRFTMTVDGTRLYARMGSPYTSFDQRSGLTVGKSYLVGLDLAAEGKLLWKPIEPDDDSWSFEGAPVSDGKQIYVGQRKATGGASPQCYVTCFDADTRRMKWRRYIGTADTWAQGSPEITHNLLTLHRDTLYYNTNMGMVAAIATDGRMKWITVYPRAKSYDPGRPADFKYRDLTPCIYYQGLVLVAPSDCDAIFALDAETGRREWETRLPEDAVHLLGVAGGHLIASGRRIYWIQVNPVQRDRGSKISFYWPDSLNSGLQGYGRGVLAGDYVYWPTEESIYVFHQQLREVMRVGQPIRMSEFGATGGNLLATDGYLLVAEDKSLVCLSQVSAQRREPLEMAVRQQPDAAEPYYHLARYDEATGRWNDAQREYEACLKLAGPTALLRGKPLAKVAADRLFRLLVTHSEQLVRQNELADAAARLEAAAGHATRPMAELSALLRAAQLWMQAEQPVRATAVWQRILDSDKLSSIPVTDRDGQMTFGGPLADELLAHAIAQRGPQVYAEMEKDAAQAVTEFQKENDFAALEQAVERYRHAVSLHAVLREQSRQVAEQKHWHRAIAVLKRWLATGPPEVERIVAQAELATAYEAIGYLDASAAVWRALAEEHRDRPAADLKIPDSPSGTISELVHARLANAPYQTGPANDERGLWTRRRDLPLAGPLLVPTGKSPDGRTYALEFDGERVHLLDPDTGERRWKVNWSRVAPRWAGYSRDALLLASDHDVCALVLDSGQEQWRRELMPGEGATLLGPDHLAPALVVDELDPDALKIPSKALAAELNGDTLDAAPCRLEQLELGEPGLCLRLGRQRIAVLDPDTGRYRWGYQPPDGELTSDLCVCGPFVLVQVAGPKDRLAGRAVVLSATGKRLHIVPTTNTPWPRKPFAYDRERAIVVADATTVQMIDLAAGQVAWERRDFLGASPGQEPDVLCNGRDLVVVFNGEFLNRVDPDNGSFLWPRAVVLNVGAEIVRQPRQSLAMDSAGVYGVWGGIARAYALADGSLRWKQDRYLDGNETRWRVKPVGAFVHAQPVDSAERTFELMVLDPATGQPVQRLPFTTASLGAQSRLGMAAGWVWSRDRAWILSRQANQ